MINTCSAKYNKQVCIILFTFVCLVWHNLLTNVNYIAQMTFDDYCSYHYGELKRLAELCGITEAALSSIRKGRVKMSIEYAVIIDVESINHECSLEDMYGKEKAAYLRTLFRRCVNRPSRMKAK